MMRGLQALGYKNLVFRRSAELDLRDPHATAAFFDAERPDYVFLGAAKVGGIEANRRYPADFIYDNLAIEINVIHQAYAFKVKKLIFLGSSCIYPKHAEQPIKEEALLTGPLEPTNEAYAVAKIAGIKMCESYNRQYGTVFIPVMPTNLYGPNDNFDLENAHVLPALIRKCHEAKMNGQPTLTVWGSGRPRREFLHADDLADACIHIINESRNTGVINIGVGRDISIIELAQLIQEIVGYKGEIVLDPTKPDGTPRKLLDITKLTNLGWKARFGLREGIADAYRWYLENQAIHAR